MSTNDYRPLPEFTPERIAAFWNRVNMLGPDECWPWIAATTKHGYGSVRYGGIEYGARDQAFFSHRIAFFLSTGVDPGKKCVRHSCDNPPCNNPKHLILGTKKQNTEDMKSRGRDRLFKEGHYSGFIGVNAFKAKPYISEIDIYLMREMYFSGLFTQRYLARTFSLSSTTVARITLGQSWRHVPMPPIEHCRAHRYHACEYR